MRNVRQLLQLLLAAACVLGLASCGPRMIDQPSFKPYKHQMRLPPKGIVPTEGRNITLTALASAAANPLRPTRTNLRNGKIFYGYYCLQCHGETGTGEGPVGQSYVPKPTDLSSPAVKALTDGQLYRRMLIGVGHDPVLTETVLPEHRWPLVLYVRTLATKPPSRPPSPQSNRP